VGPAELSLASRGIYLTIEPRCARVCRRSGRLVFVPAGSLTIVPLDSYKRYSSLR
jgi:hypothetical protein